MTTADFIEKALRGQTKRDWCSSVMQDTDYQGNVTVYSYGTHYPLATIINGIAFVNNRGYSMTTSKHINWANRACANIVGYDNVYSVPSTYGLSKGGMIKDLTNHINTLTSTMASKKRKNTQVYQWLQYDYDKAVATLKVVKELA